MVLFWFRRMPRPPCWALPDAAVVLEGAGCFLALQAQLDGTWVVLLLQETGEGRGSFSSPTAPRAQLDKTRT